MLHDESRPAFFLRIENVLIDFALAFDRDAGNHEEFLCWVDSGEEGWVFLDSVDEARLRSPKDFELAIAFVGRALAPILSRAHVLITGREAAWRARTDRDLIREHLPYESPHSTVTPDPGADRDFPASEGQSQPDLGDPVLEEDAYELIDEDLDAEAARASLETTARRNPSDEESNTVLVVGFDDLSEPQVAEFAREKGVPDVPDFIRAVERKQAHSETARPLDLEGLVDYWKAHGRIGSRFELTEATIVRRLDEPNPDRAEATELTADKLRHAARQLATANAMMQTPEILLHDAPIGLQGVEPAGLLSWSTSAIRTLLMRPLFIASQFGAVRLYVQRAREFLTAEWLRTRLDDSASRRKIESLFFRKQYGVEVVVPSMRGVLPWLALLDSDVLARVRRVAPEVMFEGGDPSRLPLDMRCSLLSQACARLVGKPGRSSLDDLQVVQRFAAPELADHIKELLEKYSADSEVIYFLLRMIWQGEIIGVLKEAKEFASNAEDYSVRLIAIRTVGEIGQEGDRVAVRDALFASGVRPDREWVAEAIETLPKDSAGVEWLIAACAGVKPTKRFSIDRLPRAVEDYASEIPISLLAALIAGLRPLLAPATTGSDVDGGARGCRSFDWLVGAAITSLDRLVLAKDTAVFDKPAIALLLRLPSIASLGNTEYQKDSERLVGHVGDWSELNHFLFWADVKATRARRRKKNGEAVRSVFALGAFGHYWRLTVDDGRYLEDQISMRSLLDDRLVALTAAFFVLRDSGVRSQWRHRLRKRTQGTPELKSALSGLLAPPSQESKRWQRETARLTRRSKRQDAKRDRNREKWRAFLPAHLESLRIPFPGGGIRQNQYYLYERLRDADRKSSRWTEGNWRSLIPEFGIEVATAFRDGAIAFWRTHTPKVLSTGAEHNRTPATTLYGLAGLSFESRTVPGWASALTQDEAELATRYAMRELNGFPPWLPRLFKAHPVPVKKVILGEIDFELQSDPSGQNANTYVLNDVSSVGQWAWSALMPELVNRLSAAPTSSAHLRQLLTMLAGSDVPDADIAAVASTQASRASDEAAALWFAGWIGVDPSNALPVLATHLLGLGDRDRQVNLAMHCLVALTGGRHERRVARNGFRTVAHLTTLFLLMHQYIAEDQDIQRAGQGVFSPGLRDDAQAARDALLSPLRDTPGEEAYHALRRISHDHPSQRGRDWAAKLSLERATSDADRPGWTGGQVREFQDKLERTPRNHQELHDLAVERLLDYKHFLEHGETSHATVLLGQKETAVRNVASDWCKQRGLGRYMIAQEEEFADSKRTDFRFLNVAFDNPVPVELKLANGCSGAELVERLENQLCNDYLRDERSNRGIFLLMYQGGRAHWEMPDGTRVISLVQLVEALQNHWDLRKIDFPHVQAVHVVGIDLTLRAKPMGRRERKRPKTPASSSSRKQVASKSKSAAKELAGRATPRSAPTATPARSSRSNVPMKATARKTTKLVMKPPTTKAAAKKAAKPTSKSVSVARRKPNTKGSKETANTAATAKKGAVTRRAEGPKAISIGVANKLATSVKRR